MNILQLSSLVLPFEILYIWQKLSKEWQEYSPECKVQVSRIWAIF